MYSINNKEKKRNIINNGQTPSRKKINYNILYNKRNSEQIETKWQRLSQIQNNEPDFLLNFAYRTSICHVN